MDNKVRNLITCSKMHQPREDIYRFYINKENRGKVLIQLELPNQKQKQINHYRFKEILH